MMANNKPSKRRKPSFIRYPLEEYRTNPELVKLRTDAHLDKLEDYIEQLEEDRDFHKSRADYLERVELPELPRLREEQRKAVSEIALLKTNNATLQERTRISTRMSVFQPFLALLGAIITGFGINLMTSPNSSDASLGVVLLVIGGLVGICAIFSMFITRPPGGHK